MKIEVYTLNDIQKWNDLLKEIPEENQDIFFLPEYCQTFVQHEQATPYCFVYKKKGIIIAYSFFKKIINEYDLGATYYDIFSPYGYGGVISNVQFIPEDIIAEFNATFQVWCSSNNIIAELIRCCPLLPQETNHLRLAQYVAVRTNVYVFPFNNYSIPSFSAKKNIRAAKNKGLMPLVDDKLYFLKEFQELYNENAKRLGMHHYYYFPDSYFENVKIYLSQFTKLLFIKNNTGEFIAGCLLFQYGNKLHYHLSAFNFDYRNAKPNDLLINEIINISLKENKEIINLGGGLGNDPSDSLYQFKKRYGNEFKTVLVGKSILNQKIYNEICDLWKSKKSNEIQSQYQNFLLKYRY